MPIIASAHHTGNGSEEEDKKVRVMVAGLLHRDTIYNIQHFVWLPVQTVFDMYEGVCKLDVKADERIDTPVMLGSSVDAPVIAVLPVGGEADGEAVVKSCHLMRSNTMHCMYITINGHARFMLFFPLRFATVLSRLLEEKDVCFHLVVEEGGAIMIHVSLPQIINYSNSSSYLRQRSCYIEADFLEWVLSETVCGLRPAWLSNSATNAGGGARSREQFSD